MPTGDNFLIERANDASLRLTRAYEAAAGSTAGVGDLDVGACLQPFFSYLDEEKALLVASKDVVDASGQLSLFMTMWVAGQRIQVAKVEAEEKKKQDELKARAGVGDLDVGACLQPFFSYLDDKAPTVLV
jgi:hypothetical protein